MRLRIGALAVAAAAALALTACSSNSNKSPATTSATTSAATTSATSSSPTVTSTATGSAADAAYCAKVAQLGTEVGKLQSGLGSLSSGDTSSARQTLQQAAGFFTQLQDGAPAELQSPLSTLASALQQAQQAFSSQTPDTSKLASLLTSVAPAIGAFTQWSATHCATTGTGSSPS